ncbi:MAG TPA: hypothetical protein VFW47_10055 [Phenylobacterium sp.]|nr:hypothetical protein [Phenylobacterium sp.]
MIKPVLLAVAACAALSACATPTPTAYGPASGPRAVGFSEFRLEPGRYRITFRGGPGAPAAQVADYALLRAADLALADGYDWFRVYDRRIEGETGNGPRVSLGVGGASFGGHSAVGVGVSRGFELGGGPSLTQTLEVVMGKGDAPRDPDVYNAREVRGAIGPRA